MFKMKNALCCLGSQSLRSRGYNIICSGWYSRKRVRVSITTSSLGSLPTLLLYKTFTLLGTTTVSYLLPVGLDSSRSSYGVLISTVHNLPSIRIADSTSPGSQSRAYIQAMGYGHQFHGDFTLASPLEIGFRRPPYVPNRVARVYCHSKRVTLPCLVRLEKYANSVVAYQAFVVFGNVCSEISYVQVVVPEGDVKRFLVIADRDLCPGIHRCCRTSFCPTQLDPGRRYPSKGRPVIPSILGAVSLPFKTRTASLLRPDLAGAGPRPQSITQSSKALRL